MVVLLHDDVTQTHGSLAASVWHHTAPLHHTDHTAPQRCTATGYRQEIQAVQLQDLRRPENVTEREVQKLQPGKLHSAHPSFGHLCAGHSS